MLSCKILKSTNNLVDFSLTVDSNSGIIITKRGEHVDIRFN